MKVAIYILIVLIFSIPADAAEDAAGGGIHQQIERGDAYINEDKYDQAIRAYGAAVKSFPGSSEAHERLARALGLNGDIAEAVSEDQKAIEIDPRNALAHSHLGWARGVQKMYHQAVNEERAAIQLDPSNLSAYLTLGLALASLGDFDGAIAADRKAIELEPDSLKAYTNLGATLGRKGDFTEAVKVYQRALELNPRSLSAHLGLGAALGKLGQTGKQIAEFESAVTLAPASDSAHGKLGWALYKDGNWQGALKEGFITNWLRLSKSGPQYLSQLLNIWAGIFLLFGLLFAVIFFGARFKPGDGETVIRSYFLIFYKDKPGRFVITSKRLAFVPESFSTWFGSQPVFLERSKVRQVKPLAAGKIGVEVELEDGANYEFRMPNLVLKPLLASLQKSD